MDEDQTQEEAPEDRTLQGGFHPALAQFVESLPADEANSSWGISAANKIQDYLTLRSHAQAADAAEQKWTSDLNATKANLIGMVQSDPMATDLALSLAPDAVGALTAHHPDEEQRTAATEAIASHIQNQIAHTSIQSIAAIDRDAAHAAIDRYAPHLGEEEANQLRTYADNLHGLRLADGEAQRQEQARQAVAVNNHATRSWLTGLTDPATGEIVFKPGWGVNMMQDGRLGGESKAALHTAYTNLQVNGDAPSSDPRALTDMIQRLALPPQDPGHPLATDIIKLVGARQPTLDADYIDENTQRYNAYNSIANSGDPVVDAAGRPRLPLGFPGPGNPNPEGTVTDNFHGYDGPQTGDPVIRRPDRPLVPHEGSDVVSPGNTRGVGGLTMSDARWLLDRVGHQPTEARNDLLALNDLMGAAKDTIGNDRAYSRFTDWLMPAVRAGGSIDPDAQNYVLRNGKIQDFMPTGDDIIAPVVAARGDAPRRSLGEIFGAIGGTAMRSLENLGRAGVRSAGDYYAGRASGAAVSAVRNVQTIIPEIATAAGSKILPMVGSNTQIIAGTVDRLSRGDFGPEKLTTPDGKPYNPDTDA